MSVIGFDAKIDLLAYSSTHPRSWFITFGVSSPARGMFTEVAITGNDDFDSETLDRVVRAIAVELYGTAWAFHYPPDDYESAIERYNLVRREKVVVARVEAWS